MKNFIKAKLIILLIISIICFANIAKGQWIQTNGPYGGRINCLAIDDSLICAVSDNNFYISQNNGLNWTIRNIGISPYDILSIAIQDSNIYIGSYSGLNFSNNYGLSWISVNIVSSSLNPCVTSIAKNGNNIYAGTYNGLYYSNDNGLIWNIANDSLLSIANINSIKVDSNNVYIFSSSGVFFTSNNGTNWNKLTSNHFKSLAISGNNIYAITNDYAGLYLSTDNGLSWNIFNIGLPVSSTIKSIESDSFNIYVGTWDKGMYYLNKNGPNWWIPINTGLTNKYIRSLVINGNNIFTGTDGGGVFLSNNKGANWNAVNNGIINTNIQALTNKGDTLFAGVYGGGVNISYDNGLNWSAVNNNLTSTDIVSISVKGNDIYAGSNNVSLNDVGLYKSSNNGLNWSSAGLLNYNIFSLLTYNDSLYAGRSDGIFRSVNNTTNWELISNGLPPNPCITSLAKNGNSFYAGSNWGSLYFSNNNGSSWSILHSFGCKVNSIIIRGNELIIGTYYGIYILANNGSDWIATKCGPNDSTLITTVNGIGNNLISGSEWFGVFHSSNNCLNWDTINSGLPLNCSILSLLIKNDYIYAGTSNYGVWKRPLSDFVGIKETANPVSNLKVFPNPFSKSTTFTYTLKENQKVYLSVYDITGRIVKQLVNENQTQGEHTLSFDAVNLRAGVYYYRLQAGDEVSTGKLILAK